MESVRVGDSTESETRSILNSKHDRLTGDTEEGAASPLEYVTLLNAVGAVSG